MKKLQNKKGFTLVEMIVVLAIIAILIALLAPNVARLIQNAQRTSDNAKAKTVMNAGQSYGTEAIAEGMSIDASQATAITTKGYAVFLDSSATGGDKFEKFYYATGAPSFMGGSGDASLPSNTFNGKDGAVVYISVEGAVMGVVYHNDGNIKAVAGVAPDGANTTSVDFTTAALRRGKVDLTSGIVNTAPTP